MYRRRRQVVVVVVVVEKSTRAKAISILSRSRLQAESSLRIGQNLRGLEEAPEKSTLSVLVIRVHVI